MDTQRGSEKVRGHRRPRPASPDRPAGEGAGSTPLEPSVGAPLLALQRLAGNASVARMLAADDTEEMDAAHGPSVAGLAEALSTETAPDIADAPDEAVDASSHPPVSGAIDQGGGERLDPDLRRQMEATFQADFSTVRVHEDGAAAASARALGARAYTVGEEIVVGERGSDRKTMAHELAHVVQQRAGQVDGRPTSAGFSVSDPDDRFERAAEATAEAVTTGAAGREAVPTAVAGPAGSAQRIAVEGDDAETVQRAPALSEDELPDLDEASSSTPTTEPPGTTGGGPGQVIPVEITGDVDPGSLAAQAGVIRDDLQIAIDALSGDPPDYKGAVTAMRDGGEESIELRDKVRGDPAAHDLATFVMDTFYIVGKDIWPKAGLGGKSSDVTDAIQLEKARVDAVELAERLKGGPGGRSR